MEQGGQYPQQGDSGPGSESAGLPGDWEDLLCYGCEGQIHVEAHLGTGLHERQPILLQIAAASQVAAWWGQPRPYSPKGHP